MSAVSKVDAAELDAADDHVFGMSKGENPEAVESAVPKGDDRAAKAEDPRYEKPPVSPKTEDWAGAFGDFDTTFGELDPGNFGGDRPAQVNAVALQADGKVVVVGQGFPNDQPADPENERAFVARYNTDGTPDSSFLPAPSGDNGNGIVFLDWSGENDPGDYCWIPDEGQRANDVAIDADGRIVVVGEWHCEATAARLNTDGTYDSSFGGNGLAAWPAWFSWGTCAAPWAAWQRARSVAIRPNGHIVLGGDAAGDAYPIAYAFWAAELEPSGDPYEDATGQLWSSVLYLDPGPAVANRIAIQDDGRILQVGGHSDEWIVVRHDLAAGTTDNWYTGDDVLVISPPRRHGEAVDVTMVPPVPVIEQAPYPDSEPEKAAEPQREIPEKFLVTGISDPENKVARFHGNGILDTTFGNQGYVEIPGHGMGIETHGFSGTITVGGKIEVGNRAFAARFNHDGVPSSFFGPPNGYVMTDPISQGPGLGRDLAVQPNGRPVVAGVGSFFALAAPEDAAVARWLSDGTPDTAWSGDGFVSTPIDRPSP